MQASRPTMTFNSQIFKGYVAQLPVFNLPSDAAPF